MLMGDRWTSAIQPKSIGQHADLFETLAYTNSPDSAQRQVNEILQDIPAEKLVVGLQAYPPAADSAEALQAVVQGVKECGVRQLSFYNYGIMPRPNLAWIRQCIGR